MMTRDITLVKRKCQRWRVQTIFLLCRPILMRFWFLWIQKSLAKNICLSIFQKWIKTKVFGFLILTKVGVYLVSLLQC